MVNGATCPEMDGGEMKLRSSVRVEKYFKVEEYYEGYYYYRYYGLYKDTYVCTVNSSHYEYIYREDWGGLEDRH